MRQVHPTGFTLAELLIALSILGVIATFTIPKILQAQQDNRNKTILKETIATLEAIYHQGSLTGEYKNSTSGDYILSHLNAVKLCSTDARAQGCWTAAQGDYAGEETEWGAILATGATIAGISNTGSNNNGFLIDANGASAPNTMGQDQMWIAYCFGPGTCPALYWNASGRPAAAGSMGPIGNQESSDLYDTLFGTP